MRKLIYILFLLPFLSFGQIPDLLLASKQQATPAGPTNYYTLANAANPDSEVNATTGVNAVANWTATSVSTTPTAYNGTYSLKFTHGGPDNTGYISRLDMSGFTNGATYEVRIWANRVSGGNFRLELSEFFGWTTTVQSVLITTSITANTWYEYVLTGTTNSTTPSIRIVAASNADTGNALAIDNITITEL